MAIHAKNRREIESKIRAREPFQIDSMSGLNYAPGTGRLPGKIADQYVADNPTYVVRSYDTPIAWVARDGRIVFVGVSFSTTTSGHLGIAKCGFTH